MRPTHAAVLIAVVMAGLSAAAQETVFNVPSGDVLDRGKIYGELDFTFRSDDSSAGFTPRFVLGAGHRVEIGLNVNGLALNAANQAVLTPIVKWKTYDGRSNGWALLLGDDVFLPVQNRAYDAGTYVYAEFTKTWKTKTRATAGGYYCSAHVISAGQHGGGQFALEQPVGSHVTLAADWYTGHHSLGYLSPGTVVKITPKLSLYAAYQIGNSGVSSGNHQLLIQVGWNVE